MHCSLIRVLRSASALHVETADFNATPFTAFYLVRQTAILAICFFLACGTSKDCLGQPTAPRYEECRLDSIYPAGGRRGTAVRIEIKGYESGLTGFNKIIVDGPPGVKARDFKVINGYIAEATLEIAPDAPLGRRWLRCVTERSGLTNFAQFVVSALPELSEVEPNNELQKPQVVPLPLVMNGRINPAADLDVFRFSAKKGQRLVAAIAAHGIDIHGQNKFYGIADFSLELLDANGRTLASAEDTLGYDPLIEYTVAEDGDYFAKVQLLNFQGFPEAVYRLTLGEVPYVTSAFPPGYRRGTPTEIELFGPNIPAGTKVIVGKSPGFGVPNLAELGTSNQLSEWNGEEGSVWDPAYVLRYVTLNNDGTTGVDAPVVNGNDPESTESEPNDDRMQASLLHLPSTVNARFQNSRDADWYRIPLQAQQKVRFEITAHRYLKSPIDSLIQIFNEQGQLLLENDDEVFEPGYEQFHDFKTTDSQLSLTAPVTGNYFVRISEQSGVNGPRAVYRLTVREDEPDFRLTHFPDALPIWGPGSTACVLTRIDRLSGFNQDIDVSVEGLPKGWSSSPATSLATTADRPLITYQLKVFLTLTAPPDAAIGTYVPFRIVGKAKRPDGTVIERRSIPLTLYYTSDTGFFRASPVSRAVVTKSQGPWLEAVTTEISVAQGGDATLIAKVHGAGDLKLMPVVVNQATFGVACVLTTPQNLPITNGLIEVPIKLPPELFPGTYGITIAQTWRSDIRIGMPGPCTALIKLTVLPSK